MEHNTILQCHNLGKDFKSGSEILTVLDQVTLSLDAGEKCAVIGRSGSGKTTLLSLLAGFDRPSSGSITLLNQDTSQLSQDALARLRGTSIGFVFQNYQLLPNLTALENVLLPLEIRGVFDHQPAKDLLEKVGLNKRMHHYAHQLSGGEQQRVALARAFAHKPALIFADEPTGSLDPENAQRALRILFELNQVDQAAILLVTHDALLAKQFERKITLHNGKVIADER